MSQKKCSWNINKLLLQRPKNRPEMEASFLFNNILGTIADNLGALIEFTHIQDKSIKLPFETKDSKHLVGTNGDDLSALIEFTPLWKTRVSNYPL